MNKTLKYQILSILLFSIGLLFTKASNSSILTSFYTLIPMLIGLYTNEKVKKITIILILLLTIITPFYIDFKEDFYFVLIGIIFSSIAALSNSIIKMKSFYLLSNISWLMFDIKIMSIGAIIFDIIGFIGLTIFFIKNNEKISLFTKKIKS
jgi:drug/metabolite transporter (DMT)-like permease